MVKQGDAERVAERPAAVRALVASIIEGIVLRATLVSLMRSIAAAWAEAEAMPV